MKSLRASLFLTLLAVSTALAQHAPSPKASPPEPARPFKAAQVFDFTQPVIFQDDFSSGQFRRWNFSEDDRYKLQSETPERIRIVDAPGLPGKKAARFFVPRGANSFRAEVSLPHEAGFQERWYGERIYVPEDWVPDPARAVDIVMQWHAISGTGTATFPNLEISVGHTSWHIRQSFGNAKTKPERTRLTLDEPVSRGAWVAWVIHARWSAGDDGLVQIWRDGKLVLDRKGPNAYGDIDVAYTPYLKTGIYRPEWHIDSEARRTAFERETPAATSKTILITDVKIGDARATYESVAPRSSP
jgi:hypothetical protein